jgi:hypothetical protein
MKGQLFAAILALATPLCCLRANSAATSLENELLQALKANSASDGRLGNPSKVISHYAEQHLIDAKRTIRTDFDDYYLLLRPALFLGHDLLVMRWGHGREASDGPTGCCATEGLTVYVRVNGDDALLVKFSKANRCYYDASEDLVEFWKDRGYGSSIQFPEGRYASIECTDRTLEQERVE